MTAGPDLAGLLADRPHTVVLTQASTPTEARLIRERISAAGGAGRPPVSLGSPGGLPPSLLDDDEDVRLVPVRVAWLPEEHAGRRAARVADLLPGHDPYRPSERQQQRILARQPGRARVLAGEPATSSSRISPASSSDGGDPSAPRWTSPSPDRNRREDRISSLTRLGVLYLGPRSWYSARSSASVARRVT